MRSDFQANLARVKAFWDAFPQHRGSVRETSRILSTQGEAISPSTVSRVAGVLLQNPADPWAPPSVSPDITAVHDALEAAGYLVTPDTHSTDATTGANHLTPLKPKEAPTMPAATSKPIAPLFKAPQQRVAEAAAAVGDSAGGDVNSAVQSLVAALAAMAARPQAAALDADAVRAIVAPMIADLARPTIMQIIVPERPASEVIDSAHKSLPQAVTLANVLRLVWLCGPAGSGKTTLAEQIAKAMSLPFGSLSCTAGMSEAHLTGRPTLQGGYLPARFVELYETGGVFLFDEMDACDPNTALVINSALANGYLSVPYRTEHQRANRHKDFVCVIATNTWGNGADPQYLGRNGLDLATRDRFAAAKLLIDYDQDLERRIVGDDRLHDTLQAVRVNIKTHTLRRIMSTRAMVQVSALVRAGLTPTAAIECYLTDWTTPERTKGMDGVRIPNKVAMAGAAS